MAFTVTDVRLDGCLLGRAGERDYRTVFHDDNVPDRVDLRPYCTPVEQQGQIGSCTANAAVGALEYHFKRRDGRAPDLSRMFVYYNARRLRGQVFFDTGAQIREAMAALVAFGACREEVWPYDPMLFAAEPPSRAYQDASRYEAIQYARVDGVPGAVSALAKGLPVVFGTPLPRRCYEEAAATGVIPEPTQEELNTPPTGGHAMLIVGYDKTERMFILRNSWGEQWGDHGYCRIPFNVMEAWTKPEDFWVIAELEQNKSFQLVRPSGERTPPSRAIGGGGPATASVNSLRDRIRSGLEVDLAAASKKIDTLLSRGIAASSRPSPPTHVMPCTACAGSGICPFCQEKPGTCGRCKGTRACADCGGTGTI